MPDLFNPYVYVRTLTIGLGSFWTLRGLWRTVMFLRTWERRLELYGFSRSWLRCFVLRMLLRATILDPLNAALMAAIGAFWIARRVLDVSS